MKTPIRKKLAVSAFLLALLLIAGEAVFGFASFALFPPKLQGGAAARTEAGASDRAEVSVAAERESAPRETELPLLLEIANGNPLRQMRNVRVEILPGEPGTEWIYTDEAQRVDIPRASAGFYSFAVEMHRERYESLLAGREKATARVKWGDGLYRDFDLRELMGGGNAADMQHFSSLQALN
ncbi:hypothetical protein QWJ34_23105 [Saccharibacillus sp. CPCC 101409]|uniref:hypothetical protein n=1 Tax=Saccharibacillus sp. CPCC 101409 TaxID=3058041 RepID=UPI002670DA4E|nr:hypothetical protein [Saccharibacillus sp. CPCC 101409]MDO3412674.1 hypothetical protein [Saccharibacillus sp. CPCC 101409]